MSPTLAPDKVRPAENSGDLGNAPKGFRQAGLAHPKAQSISMSLKLKTDEMLTAISNGDSHKLGEFLKSVPPADLGKVTQYIEKTITGRLSDPAKAEGAKLCINTIAFATGYRYGAGAAEAQVGRTLATMLTDLTGSPDAKIKDVAFDALFRQNAFSKVLGKLDDGKKLEFVEQAIARTKVLAGQVDGLSDRKGEGFFQREELAKAGIRTLIDVLGDGRYQTRGGVSPIRGAIVDGLEGLLESKTPSLANEAASQLVARKRDADISDRVLTALSTHIDKIKFGPAVQELLFDAAVNHDSKLALTVLKNGDPDTVRVGLSMLYSGSRENPTVKQAYEQSLSLLTDLAKTPEGATAKKLLEQIDLAGEVSKQSGGRLNPFRFSHEVLTALASQSQNGKRAVITMPEHDPNGAFATKGDGDAILSLLKKGFTVRVTDVKSDTELLASIHKNTADKKASLVVISGHGSSKGIRVGNNETDASSSFDNLDAGKMRELGGCVTPKGKIIVNGCSTGEGENSFGERLSRCSSRETIAPTGSIEKYILVYKNDEVGGVNFTSSDRAIPGRDAKPL